jgi:hypothetical protein
MMMMMMMMMAMRYPTKNNAATGRVSTEGPGEVRDPYGTAPVRVRDSMARFSSAPQLSELGAPDLLVCHLLAAV